MKCTNNAPRATAVVFVICASLGALSHSEAATITAASCSLADVRAAVNNASDGDKILIPNGSCAWGGGIETTKQIRIEAQNYTPTPRGTMTRSVTITNNSTTLALFTLKSGNSYHVGLAGITFKEGAGNQNHVRFEGTGSKVPLLNDCAFEVKQRNGANPDISVIAWLSQGGVAWNLYTLGVGGGVGRRMLSGGSGHLYQLTTRGEHRIHYGDARHKRYGQRLF